MRLGLYVEAIVVLRFEERVDGDAERDRASLYGLQQALLAFLEGGQPADIFECEGPSSGQSGAGWPGAFASIPPMSWSRSDRRCALASRAQFSTRLAIRQSSGSAHYDRGGRTSACPVPLVTSDVP